MFKNLFRKSQDAADNKSKNPDPLVDAITSTEKPLDASVPKVISALNNSRELDAESANTQNRDSAAHYTGTCTGEFKWFDDAKGFGFIVSEGEDVHVHKTALPVGYAPQPNDIVSFEKSVGKTGRVTATSVIPQKIVLSNYTAGELYPVGQSVFVQEVSVQANDKGTHTGDIKWFDETKGFGFIVSRGEDIFVHHTGLPEGYVPQPEDIVSFEETVGKDGRLRATSVVPHEGDFSNAPINGASPKRPIDTAELYDWAYMPMQRSSSQSILKSLANLALTEDWSYREHPLDEVDQFGVLRSYIRYTFTRLHHEKKIVELDDLAAFNTGLVDRFYEPIYALFERNDRETIPWKFRSFCISGQGDEGKLLFRRFTNLPVEARYFGGIDDVFFDPDAPFEDDIQHIILDGVRRDRYPHGFLELYAGGFSKEEYSQDPSQYLEELARRIDADDEIIRRFRNRLKSCIELSQKKVKWNYRSIVPQYYPRHDQMSFLLPIALQNDSKIDAALVVQKQRMNDNSLRYQAYTIFPLPYAYRNARLVAKPISDWLTPEFVFG